MRNTGVNLSRRGRVMAMVFALTWLAGWRPICLAETTDGLTRFTIRSWGERDALATAEITGLGRTPDGFLWLGTTEGLIRFDGKRFVAQTTNTVPALGNGGISSLLVDATGDLWVGTPDGTVERRHQNDFVPVALAESLRGKPIAGLVEDPGRGVWVLSPAGVARVTATNCSLIQVTNWNILRLATRGWSEGEGDLLCLTPRYAFLFQNGDWQMIDAFQRAGPKLLSVCARREGGAWLGVSSDGMYLRGGQVLELKDGEARVALEPYPWPGDSIRTSVQAIWEDRRGRVWVGTSGSGVFFWSHPKGWQRLASEGALANAVVKQLQEDSEGIMWIATEGGGLHQVREQAVDTLLLPERARQGVIETVCASNDGSLWVGTDGGGSSDGAMGNSNPRTTGWAACTCERCSRIVIQIYGLELERDCSAGPDRNLRS